MIPLEVEEIRELAAGELAGEGPVTGMQIDSRRIRSGDLFVAVGDGARFLDDARASGAAATLVPDDAFAALAAIAGAVRDRSSARVVGITGSSGKTSTKDILAALCAPVARTIANEASFNAELGVPLTLCRLEPDTELCLVEMGMRGFGQIAELCRFARPDAARDHRDRPGAPRARRLGRRRRAREGRAARGAAGRGAGDRAGVERSSSRTCGTTSTSAASPRSTPSSMRPALTVAFRGRRIHFPLRARHQAQNALTALHAYEALGLPLDRVDGGCGRRPALPLARRGAAAGRRRASSSTTPGTRTRRRWRPRCATSPSAARAAAGSPCSAAWPSSATTPSATTASSARSPASSTSTCSRVGELARGYGAGEWSPDAAAALARLRELVRPGDAVLVKASRAVGLEGIAPALANHSD